ncbi:hypothetical protein R70723_19475 [Paenibacillus sp. FSL R7-0273]|uniref:hypothetical protein n=1 Tax=Paenibacillus sp. FSL R7-0273 TaxID=1536772 RepID=UPI0004F5EF55|nr:hypothetical protein [Paenibacillus sp. FSL R7-0273]AIQ47835.1 hypothetical protein R70723_19475 [Paenibacillus sp. FSL R7-0273]OMF94610.1 hypothetical protein BK144_08810 [Paenibacillus sp. FSL R7-0273]
MSLKPVELQIALPRTTDAGKVQNELLHRPVLDQQQLAGQNVKHAAELARRTNEIEESPDSKLRNDGERGNGQGNHPSGQGQRKGEAPHDAEHPYKGRRFDLSL